MADSFSFKNNSVVEIGVFWVSRSTSIKERLTRMKHKRDANPIRFTLLLKCQKLLKVIPNGIWPVFLADEIET